MHRITGTRPLIPLAAVFLLLAAPLVPAAGDHEGGHDHDVGHGHAHGSHDFDFGAAAPDAEPDRTIEVIARDSMDFEPESIIVEPGEVVRFEVRNTGRLQHSFTLGSPDYQQQHEQEMQGMAPERMAGHMDDEPNGIVVQPSGTGTLTWRFERGGPVQFACHIPGHYPAGMKGSIRVQ